MLQKISLIFCAILISLTILPSCDNADLPDMMKSAGDTIKNTTNTEPYKNLNVESNFHIVLVKDTVDFVTIVYGENIIDNINIKISNETLSLSDDTKFAIVRNNSPIPIAECHYTSLQNVVVKSNSMVKSIGTIDIKSIVFKERIGQLDITTNSPQFNLEIWDGTGNYQLSGNTDLLTISAQYTSIINAEKLTAKVAKVESITTGNIYLNVLDTLYAQIKHTGNIICNNNCVIVKSGNGKGKIITNN